MSRASIRAAVTAYLQPSNGVPVVTGLYTVLPTQPKTLDSVYFDGGQPGIASGAVGVVFFERQHEQAQTMDGNGGGRLTNYGLAFQVFHRSVEDDASVAMSHFDSVIDALCTRLRSDPSLGLGVATAQAQGLISSAYESLSVEFGEPEAASIGGGAVDTWAVVRFDVLEWNQPT